MKKMFFVVVLSLGLTSCASIITGSKKTVMIKSNEQADIYMNGHLVAKTNQYFDIHRSNLVKYIEVKKEGCQTAGYEFPVKTNPAYWVNVPFALTGFGLSFAVYDLAVGAHQNTLKEHTVNIDCGKK